MKPPRQNGSGENGNGKNNSGKSGGGRNGGDIDRDWSLAGRVKGATPMLRCACGALVPLAVNICPECGAVLYERTNASANHHEHADRRGAALVEINKLATMRYGQALRWAGNDRARLRLVAQARGYKMGWVWHRLQELEDGR